MSHADLTLSTGRAVRLIPAGENMQELVTLAGDELTAAEWEEYCEIVGNGLHEAYRKNCLVKATILLGFYTRGSFDIYGLAGPANGQARAKVLSALVGNKMPVSKSGITAIRSEFYSRAAISGGCDVEREDNFIEFCRALIESRKASE